MGTKNRSTGSLFPIGTRVPLAGSRFVTYWLQSIQPRRFDVDLNHGSRRGDRHAKTAAIMAFEMYRVARISIGLRRADEPFPAFIYEAARDLCNVHVQLGETTPGSTTRPF